jgi:tRNA (guanine9-N1)-methyltransferase
MTSINDMKEDCIDKDKDTKKDNGTSNTNESNSSKEGKEDQVQVQIQTQTREEQTNKEENKDQDEEQQQKQNQEGEKVKPLSKNQIKKGKRLEKLMAIKRHKKQQSKDARAAKAKAEGRDIEKERKIQQEAFEAGTGRKKREKAWLERFEPKAKSSFQICIDCSFENLMTRKEIGSLSNQIRYSYAMNKKSYHPVYMSVSSLSLSGQTYQNLARVEGFPDNWKARAFQCSDKPLTEVHTPKEKIVYLTSDSDNTLHELDDSKVYVIGGIVDRNRLKGATINKAKEMGLQTAKLPINEHFKIMCEEGFNM